MQYERQWVFLADMNNSGSITISDLLLWFKWLYLFPGDIVIYLLLKDGLRIGNFLETTSSSYGGNLSVGLSALFWLFFISLIQKYCCK